MADGFHIINGVAVFFGIPEFMWSGIFGFITTVCAGLMVASLHFFISQEARRKDSRLRSYFRKACRSSASAIKPAIQKTALRFNFCKRS